LSVAPGSMFRAGLKTGDLLLVGELANCPLRLDV
jgi:hypothetical protein